MATLRVRGGNRTAAADFMQTRAGRRLRVNSRASQAAILTAVIAALVLAGWFFGVEALKRIVPGLVAMNPLTAVAFLLAAACLGLSSRRPGRVIDSSKLRLIRVCAILIAAIGTLKLLDVALGLDLGVDRLLFGAKLAIGSATPNQMAPNTAFNFLLIGCAFLFLHLRNGRVSAWSCVFALISGFEALLAVLGYAYGIKSLYGVGSFIPMALHTAVAFLLVSAGIMCCQAQRGLLAVMSGGNAGGAMARRLLPAAIFIPAVLGWLRLEGQRANLYDAEFGVALYTVTNMVVFGSIICCNALSLFRTDTERTKAERRLKRAHGELEARVAERTAELSSANAALIQARDELEDRVRERTATLAQTEGRLHAIVDNANSLIVVKDLEGKYVLVNQRFAALVGQPKEEIIGRTGSDFFPEEVANKFRKHDALALRSENSIEVAESILQNGHRHSFIANKFPLRDAAGNIYALCDISTDITGQKHLENALRESKQRLEAAMQANQLIMDNSQDVICSIDEEGRFASVSAASQKLWGYKPDELIGRKYIEMVKAEDRAKTEAAAAAIIAGQSLSDFDNCYLRKDGSFVNVMWSAHWSEAEKRMFCVARDVTERSRADQELRNATEEAHRANRAKSEFLSRMSHELRTPMNAILGFAQLLELDDLNGDQRDGVDHILRGGRHLLELINEVLDISRIEAGHLSLSPEPVEMGDAIRETLNLVQPLARARDVRLNPAPACAAFVRADRQRVKQVLINLLSNAIKYNRLGGSVTISCEEVVAGRAEAGPLVAGGAEAGHAAGVSAPGYNAPTRLRVSITDTGIGIPAERLQQLFVPFERLGAEQSTVEGTGLGLAVAKRLVEAMDGTLGVESHAGQGSTFWVEFPLTESPLLLEAESEESIAPVVNASDRPRTVLYIEDNLSNLRLIERVLERRPEVTLVAAAEGLAGLNMAREHQPDLILLDVNLPDIDGHEVLVRLRGDPACASIPVLVISADATRGQIERLKNAGASEYLTKPLDVGQFLEALDRTLVPATAA